MAGGFGATISITTVKYRGYPSTIWRTLSVFFFNKLVNFQRQMHPTFG